MNNQLEFSRRVIEGNASKITFNRYNNNNFHPITILFPSGRNFSESERRGDGDEEQKKNLIHERKKERMKERKESARNCRKLKLGETHLVTRQQLPPLFRPRFTHGCARSRESCAATSAHLATHYHYLDPHLHCH